MEIQGKIKLLKSNQVDSSGVAVAPLASELEFGQIAVNYSALNPSLFFKDANGKVVKIVTEEVIADTLADILGGSAADLSTLKELLDAFATSDIATVQADVLKRLSAVETGKVDKVAGKGLSTNDYTNADKAHMTNTSNPHGVTKAQVGLSNVLNKEQLGKDENAVSSSILRSSTLFNIGNENPQTLEGVFHSTISSTSSVYPTGYGSALTITRNAGAVTSSSMISQLFINSATINDDNLYFRRGLGDGSKINYSNWFKMWHSGNNLFESTTNTDLNTLDKTKWSTVSIGNFENLNNPSTYVQVFNFGGASNNWGNVQLASYVGGSNNFYLRGYQDTGKYKDWVQLYHTGNSNNWTSNWTANNLKAITGHFKSTAARSLIVEREGSNDNNSIVFKAADLESYLGVTQGVLKFGTTLDLNTNGKVIYHAGNSNKADIDWRANNLYLTGSVYNTVDTTQWLYHVKRSDNSQVRGVASDGWDLQFHTNNANRLTIDSGGNVGINNPKPTEKLHVDGTGFFKGNDTATLYPLIIRNSINTETGDGNVGIKFMLSDASNNSLDSNENKKWCSIQTGSKGAWGSHLGLDFTINQAYKKIVMMSLNGTGCNVNGNVTAKGDVVAYSATNNVRIEPTAGGASNLFDLADVELPTTISNNLVLAYDASKKKWTAKESVGTGGAKVDYDRLTNLPTTFTPKPHNHEDATYVSDVRLKQNINPLDNALNTVLALDAKSFGWTTEAKERYNMKDEVSYGYIAQDVEKIIPDIVKELETGDGYIGVEYIKVIPFITEAIKQLHFNTIESNLNLKKELNKMNKVYSSLFNDYKQLKTDLAALKAR